MALDTDTEIHVSMNDERRRVKLRRGRAHHPQASHRRMGLALREPLHHEIASQQLLPADAKGKYRAVRARHDYLMMAIPGFVAQPTVQQRYGTCEAAS